MDYKMTAASAVKWALSKVGCAYSQAKRTNERPLTVPLSLSRTLKSKYNRIYPLQKADYPSDQESSE